VLALANVQEVKRVKRWMCKGKVHRATVTESDLDYEGSIEIDETLMKAAHILPFEMVQITSLRNASLWKTYAIPSKEEGKIGLNGPPALLFQPGDQVVILSMSLVDEEEVERLQPRVVWVDQRNRIVKIKEINNLLKDCGGL
jgi:aspartate 1-decarboxylase